MKESQTTQKYQPMSESEKSEYLLKAKKFSQEYMKAEDRADEMRYKMYQDILDEKNSQKK